MIRRLVWTLGLFLLGVALAQASDTQDFTVNVSGAESVTIDVGSALTTVNYNTDTTYCSPVDRFCNWYPTIIYDTNYTTNRKLVASATTSDPILSVQLIKQGPPYDNPFAPSWGRGGTSPGTWAFSGTEITLSTTDQDIVLGIQNGQYAIAPILRLAFSSSPPAGSYTATVTFTIMAQ